MHLCRARNHWNLSGSIQEVAQTTSDQLRLGAPHSKTMLGLGFRVRVYGIMKNQMETQLKNQRETTAYAVWIHRGVCSPSPYNEDLMGGSYCSC